MRGRKPIATHLKIIAGNPGRRPLNRSEPVTPPLNPRAPGHFDDELKVIWRQVLREWPPGLLRQQDRAMVELLCTLVKETRHPPVRTAVFSRLQAVLESLGGSPSARSRISMPTTPASNPFANL